MEKKPVLKTNNAGCGSGTNPKYSTVDSVNSSVVRRHHHPNPTLEPSGKVPQDTGDKVPNLQKSQSASVGTAPHPAFDDSRIHAKTVPSADVFNQKARGFTEKLYGVLPTENSDPGAQKANDNMWSGRTKNRAEQSAEPMAIKPLSSDDPRVEQAMRVHRGGKKG